MKIIQQNDFLKVFHVKEQSTKVGLILYIS